MHYTVYNYYVYHVTNINNHFWQMNKVVQNFSVSFDCRNKKAGFLLLQARDSYDACNISQFSVQHNNLPHVYFSS